MNETRALEDAVRDRALALDLEALRGRMPRAAGRGARWSPLLAAVAVLLVVTIALLERGRTAGVQDQDDDVPEPPVVHSRAEVEALPAETEAVIVLDADVETLSALSRLRALRRVVLDSSSIRQASDPDVAVLSLSFSPIGPLAELSSLQEIALVDGQLIDPAAITSLQRLPVLRRLEIRPPQPFGLRLDRAIARALGGLTLTELVLGTRVHIEPGVIEDLARLRGLRQLMLPLRAEISMDEVLSLRALRSLRVLALTGVEGRRHDHAQQTLDDRLADLVDALPALDALQVGLAANVSHEAWIRIAGARPWRSLEVESASEFDDRAIEVLPRTLHRLALGDGVGETVLAEGLPFGGAHLRSLAIQSRDDLDAAWIRSLEVLPELVELDLHTTTSCDSAAIRELASRVPALRILNLRRGPHLNERALAAIGTMSTLRELDLSGSPEEYGRVRLYPSSSLSIVKDRRLLGLDQLAGLSDLRVLHLDHCAEIPAATLRAFAALPLRRLSLRGTPIAWDAETPDIHALRALWPDAKIDT